VGGIILCFDRDPLLPSLPVGFGDAGELRVIAESGSRSFSRFLMKQLVATNSGTYWTAYPPRRLA
jgi:hypothetical protein